MLKSLILTSAKSSFYGSSYRLIVLVEKYIIYLEKCIKVPKAALDIVVGWHLCKSHLQEDLSVLGPNLEPGELELEGKLALEQTFQHFTFFQC